MNSSRRSTAKCKSAIKMLKTITVIEKNATISLHRKVRDNAIMPFNHRVGKSVNLWVYSVLDLIIVCNVALNRTQLIVMLLDI